MCEGHHDDEQEGRHHGHHRHHWGHRRGRRGFPNREQLVERLTGYRQQLESELRNVQDLLERLGDAAAPDTGETPEAG